MEGKSQKLRSGVLHGLMTQASKCTHQMREWKTNQQRAQTAELKGVQNISSPPSKIHSGMDIKHLTVWDI